MTRILWDAPGEKRYENGVDRGVLYLPDGSGYPWNGLTAVNEAPEGGEVSGLSIDGVKYLNVRVATNFKATLEAYTYPDEFMQFDGIAPLAIGFYATDQPVRQGFGLSWRTMEGNDISSGDYKIHLAYGLFAEPTDKGYETVTDDPDLTGFSWDLQGTPQEIPGFKPMCHVILESRRLPKTLLAEIESMLYGDEDVSPRLPAISEIKHLIDNGAVMIDIVDNGDGTWTANTVYEGLISVDDGFFQINQVDSEPINEGSYTISTTPLP